MDQSLLCGQTENQSGLSVTDRPLSGTDSGDPWAHPWRADRQRVRPERLADLVDPNT